MTTRLASSTTAWARSRCRRTRLWGAQTQRAIQNFPPSGLRMPRAFIRALGLIKHAAAAPTRELGDLDLQVRAAAIEAAALEVARRRCTTISSRSTCFRPAPAPAAT